MAWKPKPRSAQPGGSPGCKSRRHAFTRTVKTPVLAHRHSGRVFLAAFVLLLVATAALFVSFRKPPSEGSEPLLVHCAAGLRPPVEEIAAQFSRETGIAVRLQYGGSNHLLATIAVIRRGDLFLPADESYLALARDRSLLRDTLPLARMHAVLAVPRGNPKDLRTLASLHHGVRLGQANPDMAAIGSLTRTALTGSGEWERIRAATLVFKPTVTEIANDLKLGTIDAAIMWDAVAAQYPAFEIIDLPQLASARAEVGIGVLACSTQPAAALRFARYLAASDRGALIFKKHRYETIDGDAIDLPRAAAPAPASKHPQLMPRLITTVRTGDSRQRIELKGIHRKAGEEAAVK